MVRIMYNHSSYQSNTPVTQEHISFQSNTPIAHGHAEISSTPALSQLRDSIQHTQSAIQSVHHTQGAVQSTHGIQSAIGTQALVDVNPPSMEQAPDNGSYNVMAPNNEQFGDQLITGLSEDMLRRKLERKEKLKLKRRTAKATKRAQNQLAMEGGSSENLQEQYPAQDPAPKRAKISRVNTYNEGRALPQATGPITHYVLVEYNHGAPLDEPGRVTFLGCYTHALAMLPRDSPHRGFISTGVVLHENKIKITCLTPEGALSVQSIVEQCDGYSATVCVDEKMTRIIVGVPRYMAGPEMGEGELVIKALEALNHGEEDPLPVDGMRFVSSIPSQPPLNTTGCAGQMSVVIDCKDVVLEWFKRHRWELRTVSSVARAHVVKNS